MTEKLEEIHYKAYAIRDEIVDLENDVSYNNWFTKAQRAMIIRYLDYASKSILKIINYLELELDKNNEE